MKAKWISAILIIVSLVLLNTVAAPVRAADRVYQVQPGTTNVRYDKTSFKEVNGRIYQMQPGTTIVRYDLPSFIRKNGKIYEVQSGTTNIRYDRPSYVEE